MLGLSPPMKNDQLNTDTRNKKMRYFKGWNAQDLYETGQISSEDEDFISSEQMLWTHLCNDIFGIHPPTKKQQITLTNVFRLDIKAIPHLFLIKVTRQDSNIVQFFNISLDCNTKGTEHKHHGYISFLDVMHWKKLMWKEHQGLLWISHYMVTFLFYLFLS
jgi:hypothetical protein